MFGKRLGVRTGFERRGQANFCTLFAHVHSAMGAAESPNIWRDDRRHCPQRASGVHGKTV